ncbi:nucleotidyltransferase [Adhaeribacter aerolatus]|uniref:Nucleotidyltransferase n=1 Tax=Adhaeribacter aerolatus TaxID=670289 RepID=A0A512ATJ4_9BACT|nr:nucleotidyltransferase family protein [Adhaeribacter aerolatus]GEO03029.1 nucleotidyltransferase [Adhaeribacter aerolatus]
MISSKEIEQKIKEVKPILQKKFLVDRIGYFGSFARGDFSEDSDVDIIVTCKRGIGWIFFDLKDYLESVLGRKVDLVTENSLRKQWKESILSQVKYL